VPVLDDQGNPQAIGAYLRGSSFADLEAACRAALPAVLPPHAVPIAYKPLPAGKQGDKAPSAKNVPTMRFSEVRSRKAPTKERRSAKGELIAKAWADVLKLDPSTVVGAESFYDAGGNSLLAGQLAAKLQDLGFELTVLDLFENSTLDALTAFLGADAKNVSPQRSIAVKAAAARGVSIIGRAGLFPGAPNVGALWEAIKDSRTCATYISPAVLQAKRQPVELTSRPEYVKVVYAIEEAESFDAPFWKLGRTEATIMDPQHRKFLEVAYHAVEDAGYAPKSGMKSYTVGVFASCGIDGYLVHHQQGGALLTPEDPGALFLTETGNEKDYISNRVAFQNDYRGPAVTVTSACSSGLVAVAQGAAAIAAGDCDVAVCGASSLTFPNLGYLYQPGLPASPDGIVRPFDEEAKGTVFGDSVGCVVLKAQDLAERDGDRVLANLTGWSITNDGGEKAGYAAPSSGGQALAVEKAMRMAGASPKDIGYVECHCTGTEVGDAIEIAGLKKAYENLGEQPESIPIGSIKGNIGHANCAAGITGLIKTLSMMEEETLVPVANYDKLNPKLRLEQTCFQVQTSVAPWTGPRKAGVSAFGIGVGSEGWA
jgi:acyl transferase domain-containing protein